MSPNKAIAVLAIPFAMSVLLLLAGMCLTSYWDCKFDRSTSIVDLWKPALFTVVIFTVGAAVILYIDVLLIRNWISKIASYRSAVVALVGGVVALVPRVVFAAVNGQGIAALSPQAEYLPFILGGALFALALDRIAGFKT